MRHKPSPVTPDALPVEQAMRQSAPLSNLRLLLRESADRFEAIRPQLPASLAACVKPGPVDSEGWSLLAANSSVAAKLRHMQPQLEETLRKRGWQSTTIRVRVQMS